MRAFRSVLFTAIAAATIGLMIPACSPGSNGTVGSNGTGGSSVIIYSSGGSGGTPIAVTYNLGGASGSAGGGDGGSSAAPTPVWPPVGFVNVTDVTFGAYATDQNPLSSAGGASGQGGSAGGSSGASQCAGLFGVVRDFQMNTGTGGHPDFQLPRTRTSAETGIVTDTLGDDGKPIYANPPAGGTTSTKANFDQWYRSTDGINIPYVVGLRFVANASAGNGVVTFAATLGSTPTTNPGGTGRNRDAGAPAVNQDAGAPAVASSSYFPLDGLGFNDTAVASDGKQHNFAFTTEIHTTFLYNGGEKFTFQGDDDVWVYINKKLAIDLGGIHQQLQATVDLDAQAATLGISKGNSYDLAVFNAERHTTQSNFRIDTTLVFTDCGKIEGIIY
ncbi:MAG TPA: fibro-slime domain-containing protein [Polyangia bacterium]